MAPAPARLTQRMCRRLASELVLLLALPLMASAQVLVLAEPTFQQVFANGVHPVVASFTNVTAETLTTPVRIRLFQASSATAMPISEQAWKEMTLLPRQRVQEAAPVAFPAVKAPCRFVVQWLGAGHHILGHSDVQVYPTDILKQVQPLAANQPVGVFDPENVLKPLLNQEEVKFYDLEHSAWDQFKGRLAILGPFRNANQLPTGFSQRVRVLAKSGVAIVWFQFSSKNPFDPEPPPVSIRLGEGTVVLAPNPNTTPALDTPAAQLRLVQLARLAIQPEDFASALWTP